MSFSFVDRLRQQLLDRRSFHSPAAWFLQAGVVGGSLLVFLGLQGPPETPSTESPSPTPAVSVAASDVMADDGEQIYNTRCISCHQMNGQGVPGTFPPLNGTKWVTGDKGRLIRLLLDGMDGRMEVKGRTYSGSMPPWGGALDDEGIAAISTYIRSNFGNEAAPVTPDEVAKVREATADRNGPWTADELNEAANQGIPGDSATTE